MLITVPRGCHFATGLLPEPVSIGKVVPGLCRRATPHGVKWRGRVIPKRRLQPHGGANHVHIALKGSSVASVLGVATHRLDVCWTTVAAYLR